VAKKPPKRQFDWKTYSRPARRLSDEQEAAFADGLLEPVLRFSTATPGASLEIRARSASIYSRGTLLVRIGGDGPFIADLEPLGDRAAEKRELSDAVDVSELVDELERRHAELSAGDSGPCNRRDYLQTIAAANSGTADGLTLGQYLVVDLEYTYGKRRYDLVALKRTEGVTGPGGFANPRLVFVDVRAGDQTLTGPAGLEAVGADLAEFAKALGGSHLDLARFEVAELVAQKVRLGLLPPELDVRAIDEGWPELLILFAEYDTLADRRHDPTIAGLHDRLVARHFPPTRLRFAEISDVSNPDEALLEFDCAMDYRGFKDYRTRQRG
jgi:hypothetical protein